LAHSSTENKQDGPTSLRRGERHLVAIGSEFEETRMDELGTGDVAVPPFLGVFPPA